MKKNGTNTQIVLQRVKETKINGKKNKIKRKMQTGKERNREHFAHGDFCPFKS